MPIGNSKLLSDRQSDSFSTLATSHSFLVDFIREARSIVTELEHRIRRSRLDLLEATFKISCSEIIRNYSPKSRRSSAITDREHETADDCNKNPNPTCLTIIATYDDS